MENKGLEKSKIATFYAKNGIEAVRLTEEAYEKMGITKKRWRDIWSGNTEPKASEMRAITKTLNVPFEIWMA